MLSSDGAVVVDVHAAGVSFPEVLQTRGEYQVKPPLPVRARQRGGGRGAQRARGRGGERRATAWRPAACSAGFAEVAAAPEFLTFPLSDELDYAQGAGLDPQLPHGLLLARELRGRLAEGETVLVHGAAGGVGTAALQVAKGLGARTIAVVSTDDKEARGARRPAPTRWFALGRPVEGRGEGALRRRRGRGDRPGGRRPLHRQPALPRRGRAGRGGGLHRRLDPRGAGEPAAAEQHRGGGRRLGRLRDGQADS